MVVRAEKNKDYNEYGEIILNDFSVNLWQNRVTSFAILVPTNLRSQTAFGAVAFLLLTLCSLGNIAWSKR